MIWQKKWVAVFLAVALLCSIPAGAENQVLFSCDAGETKQIALTFDDGPHPVYTREILDILAEYGIRATFFVIGQNAEWFPALVQEELAAGHEIGNHTYHHANLRTVQYETVLHEILDMENAVWENVECRPHLLRPPGGLYGEDVCRAAAALDYTVILWSIDTRDWDHPSVEQIVENVLGNVEGGDIILFHDYVSGVSPTPEALRKIIPVLLAEGYEFVTVSEMLENLQ